jgi:hypothetical protein
MAATGAALCVALLAVAVASGSAALGVPALLGGGSVVAFPTLLGTAVPVALAATVGAASSVETRAVRPVRAHAELLAASLAAAWALAACGSAAAFGDQMIAAGRASLAGAGILLGAKAFVAPKAAATSPVLVLVAQVGLGGRNIPGALLWSWLLQPPRDLASMGIACVSFGVGTALGLRSALRS